MAERHAIGDLVKIQDESESEPFAPGVIVGYLVRLTDGDTFAAFESDTVSVPTLEDAEQSGILANRETLVSTAQQSFNEAVGAGTVSAIDVLTHTIDTLQGPE